MTDFDTMLRWFEAETFTTYCEECGRELPPVTDKRKRKYYCTDCLIERRKEHHRINNRERGVVKYDFSDDPAAALAYAVLYQAIHDKTWQWRAPRFSDADTDLSLAECDPQDFLENGAELWLKALGIGVRKSMREYLKEAEL